MMNLVLLNVLKLLRFWQNQLSVNVHNLLLYFAFCLTQRSSGIAPRAVLVCF